jgi:hypothetical protein
VNRSKGDSLTVKSTSSALPNYLACDIAGISKAINQAELKRLLTRPDEPGKELWMPGDLQSIAHAPA